MNRDLSMNTLDNIEQDAILEIIELDHLCDELLYFRSVLDGPSTRDIEEVYIEYEDLQGVYLNHVKGLYKRLEEWHVIAEAESRIDISIYRVFKTLKEQRKMGMI